MIIFEDDIENLFDLIIFGDKILFSYIYFFRLILLLF